MTTEQPARKPPPMQMPSDMKAFNKSLIDEFRKNKGQLSGPMAGRTLMLLTTMGSKSSQPRTTVLGFGKEGDRYVVIASNNGAQADPIWYRNLKKDPKVTVEVGAEKFPARARTADGKERDKLKSLLPYFESQQKLTSREIPFVVLERDKG